MKFKGYAYGLISSISYGLIPLFILPIKQANFSMDTTLFYRFFFSALIVGTYLFIKKQSFKIDVKQIPFLIILGLLYGISADALFLGYDYLTPGIASTLLFVYPLIVAIIMAVFFKERITISTIVAIVFVLAGVILLSFKEGKFELSPIGLGIVFISALGYGLYIVTVNKSLLFVSIYNDLLRNKNDYSQRILHFTIIRINLQLFYICVCYDSCFEHRIDLCD